MKILMHICCGPCAIYPVRQLTDQGHQVMGAYYNPNIHPFTEYETRLQTLQEYAAKIDLKLIGTPVYDMEEYLRQVVFRESVRCRICYQIRLSQTAHLAKKGKFDAFTTTLLYSKFQNTA